MVAQGNLASSSVRTYRNQVSGLWALVEPALFLVYVYALEWTYLEYTRISSIYTYIFGGRWDYTGNVCLTLSLQITCTTGEKN